jgi:hypothetical protein
MIAPVRTGLNCQRTEFVQDQFLTMLPAIRRQAWIAFRGRDSESRYELTQEVIANAYCSFVRLVHCGKQTVAFPTPLAQFAIRQVLAGRRVDSQLNKHDLLSPYARKIQGFTIERIDRQGEPTGALHQLLVEDRQAGPAEIAAARIDVAAWLGSLSKRQRRIAKTLALGEQGEVPPRLDGLARGPITDTLEHDLANFWDCGCQNGCQMHFIRLPKNVNPYGKTRHKRA